MTRNAGSRTTRARWITFATVVLLVSATAGAQTPPRRAAAMRHATLKGSGAASMQLVTMPVRVGRVAAVPGRNEMWAVGHSSSPAWAGAGPAGQILFLRRQANAPWRIVGPPRTTAGAVTNPTLFSLSFSRSGEGWAVGADGAMLHKPSSSERWTVVPPVTPTQLTAVSLAPNGAGGTIVGKGSTILRLNAGTWSLESPGTDLTADGLPDLAAVSTVSADDAWAVSGSSSQNLLIYRRTGGVWRRVRTNQRIFDGPQRPADAPNGGKVDATFGSSVAASSAGAWVGGMLFPSDATHPFGDETPGAASRPFVVRIGADGTSVTSFCPDQYGIRARVGTPVQTVDVDRTVMCDQTFPLSAFDVTSLALLPGNEVFAGGLGLYHYRSGGWFREPDAQGYIISLAMTSAREGWMATTGNTYGAGGAIHSSESTLGHWTTAPEPTRVARWPQAQVQPLEAVAIEPKGAGRALAVGAEGAVVTYEPGAGWDGVNRVVAEALHAIAFAGGEEAWAVGEGGALQRYDGAKWFRHPLASVLTTKSLFGLAFRSPTEGFAVGAGGTILRFDGESWARDPASGKVTSETLHAITATRNGYVAVGGKGTVVEWTAGTWRADTTVARIVAQPGLPTPALYAVASLADGSVWTGGAANALAVRRPGARFVATPWPIEGTVHAIAGSPDGSRMFASVSPDVAKYRGDRITTTRSVLMVNEGSGWRDISLDRRRTIYTGTDSSAYADPILGLAVGPDGAGWAVGGSPASQPDSEGHLRSEPTSSIYRFDLVGDPVPPDIVADLELPPEGFTFAVFGETWCGRGVCSATLGSGTQADLVALEIQREIARLGGLEGGPKFVMFVGNGRALGVPDELEQFKGYLDDFDLPVYGALGDRELFAGIDDNQVGTALQRANVRTSASNDYWKEVFVDRMAPWGERTEPRGFETVRAAGTVEPTAGLGRTHYAFDYQPAGKKLLRVVVVDSSTRSYGRQTDQNPEESQGDWLEKVLIDAKGLVGGAQAVPAIVVMNQPTVIPDRTQVPNWLVDARTFEESVTRNGVTAVFTGGMRTNTSSSYTGTSRVPLYILGGGGAPLGFEHPTLVATKAPTDGFYNAWHLVHVGAVVPTAAGLPQARITVTAFPILESLAMHAVDGRSVAGGQTLRFSALARSLPGGSSDPDQSKATYYWLGSAAPVLCEMPGQADGGCINRDAIKTPYKFSSENPEIADFVRSDVSRGSHYPLKVKGEPVRDPAGQEGLLCTFKAGTANINVVSGTHRSKMAIKVGGGYGPCVPAPVPPLPEIPVVITQPNPFQPQPVPRVLGGFIPRGGDSVTAIFPPPPAPVVAPAPPGAPGVGRKEEHEASHETEGHQQGGATKHQFTAQRSHRGWDAASQSWMYLGSIALLAFMGAGAGAAARRRLVEPRNAVVSERRTR